MESLSRPPHRRKHSIANVFSSSFSFKSPYDDVLLANGGERKSLETHEYSEIFSGSSSIPVLDFPGLDERVEFRNTKLDYSSIFGGFRNDDVCVPYEELLNGSAKKTKQRIPAEVRPCLQESGSLHPSRKTKRSSVEASDQCDDGVKQLFNLPFNRTNQKMKRSSVEASDLSVNGVKQQFNISFNRTNQRNSEAADEKMHIAQLQAVPGFTHFVDGTPLPDKTKGDLPSLKREVSRTWSFSAEVEPVKDKSGSSCETSQRHDKSHNENDVNPKSKFSEVPPPPSYPSNQNDNKDPGQSRVSNFDSKDDASQNNAGKCSPPLLGEEFDENSVDAVSAAALKKAIEQAQESIRIAKMIMDRKREGYREAYGSKYNNAKGKHEELDHIFNELAGINKKFTPSRSHTDLIINAASSEIKSACENVETDKEQVEVYKGKSNLLTPLGSQIDKFHHNEHVKLEKFERKVEAAESQSDVLNFPGAVAKETCGTVDLDPENARNFTSVIPSTASFGEMETGKKDYGKITIHHTKGSEVVPELVERPNEISHRMQGLEKSVEEDELCQATVNHAKEPEHVVEKDHNTSDATNGKEKITDKKDMEKSVKQLEDHEEMLNEENLTLSAEFENVLDESSNVIGMVSLEHEEPTRLENVSVQKEDQHGKYHDEEISGVGPEEAYLWIESKEQLKETLLKEMNKGEPKIPREIVENEMNVHVGYEPEIVDKKQDCTDDLDEQILTDKLMQNMVEEEQVNTTEYEAAGTIMKEAPQCAVTQVRGSFCNAEEIGNTLGGEGRSEGDLDKCEFQEAACEDDVDDNKLSCSNASTIFDEAHTNDTITNGVECLETLDACNADSNSKVEEHMKTARNCEENNMVNERISGIDENEKAELFLHLQHDKIFNTNTMHRSASEEIFVASELHDAFEGLSSDRKVEKIGVMDADHEENLPNDEDLSNLTRVVHDTAEEYVSKINGKNLSKGLASDIETAEFISSDLSQVLKQTSECDEASVSASSSERNNGFSANESEESAENAKDETINKEGHKDENEMISDDRMCTEELIEELYSQLHSEPKEMGKFKEVERDEEGDLKMKVNEESSSGTTPTEEKGAKESVQQFDSNDQQQRIEAIKRGREREKDRIAVERAIREARERAFAEARERAERAAVERATAEARQRVMAEAREKVEKANVVKQPVDKASIEAKLKAERAAVERATAEARERALEKAMSQKIPTDVGTPADWHLSERVSNFSRKNLLKHSFSSSDLESGMNTESAQRRKARLERHQRIMERAAKALAEKNMRDLLAQKEQAERNRLAESLDADIKRWATGKERNLRALLSTLQYLLGPDSGWQPIPLTEIITTAAVKKAYRKATLLVHPDKLQQRGASVQQKYICEKVFDLLKAAWNRFNSDER